MTVERHPFRRAKGPLTSTTQVDSEAATGEAVHLPEGSPGVSVSKVVGPAIEITVHVPDQSRDGFPAVAAGRHLFQRGILALQSLGSGHHIQILMLAPLQVAVILQRES